jgi:hypothetical protein
MCAASLLVLVAIANGARVKVSDKTQSTGCIRALVPNYCPAQITNYLLENIGGKPESELMCIGQFCAEGKDQCCKVQEAVKAQLQLKSALSLIPDTLAKLQKVFGGEAILNEKPIRGENTEKPIWEIEAENRANNMPPRQSENTTVESGSDELCSCPMAGRGVNLAGFGDYKKSQLFSEDGKCTSSHACNRCYHAHKTGVFGCCLKNINGASIDCAPEMRKPKFGTEKCYCENVMGSTLKSTLYDQGHRHCHPNTPCSVCKRGCSDPR